ncbi:hypothetical protein HDU67_002812 [Dinochytrium kinnereticum]|nr:hypothetical protein HDU67_002812 [Dinochytrium kinnereticum]
MVQNPTPHPTDPPTTTSPPTPHYQDPSTTITINAFSASQPTITMTSNRPTQPDKSDKSPLAPSAEPTWLRGMEEHYHTNHQVIMGSLVAGCNVLVDLGGEIGAFFVFSDLAVRASGAFRLKFDLFDVSRACVDGSQALASTISEVFHVYSPKAFPGMADSTPLTKWFAKQGIKLFVRWDGGGDRRGSMEGGA